MTHDGVLTAADLLKLLDEQKDTNPLRELSLRNASGPHKWDQITDGDYGRFFDFAVQRLNDVEKIICAHSEAALQWCYCHLPADIPRYRSHGFVVENAYVEQVITRMERDGLIDEQQYFEDMSQAGQWREE
jgi:hypothetical protein